LFILQIGLVIFSYFGGYVLGIEDYFDVRYNEISGELKLEFGGIFSSTNAFGILMYQTFALGLILLAKPGFKFKFAVVPILAAIAVLIVQINNRSSLLCLVGMLLLTLVFYFKNYWLAIVMLAGMVLSFFLMPDFVQDKFRLSQFEGEKRFGNRTELIDNGLYIIKEMNFFGVGYYNQRNALRSFGVVEESEKVLNLHNTYLAMLIEFGYLGTFIFLGGILLVVGKATWRVQNPDNYSITTLLVCAVLSMMLFHSTVEDSFNSPGSPSFNFFWFLLLMMLAISDEKPALAIKS